MLSLHIEKLDPARGELIRDSFIQNVVPWRSLPANDPVYRMHSLVAATRWKYETARERASLPGSGWEIVGIEWMDVLIAPGLENVPAPGVGGGCNVRLPESLHQRKGIWCPQVSSRCFEFCIRAAFLGVAEMDAAERRHTVRCSGHPFYVQSRGRGRPRAGEVREPVDVGLDFSAVDMGVVSLERRRLRNGQPREG